MGRYAETVRIAVSVDTGGGELQQQAEALRAEFDQRLSALCEDPKFNNDAMTVVYCG